MTKVAQRRGSSPKGLTKQQILEQIKDNIISSIQNPPQTNETLTSLLVAFKTEGGKIDDPAPNKLYYHKENSHNFLSLAVELGNIEAVKEISLAKANINEQIKYYHNDNGKREYELMPVIRRAIDKNQPEMVKTLLGLGADIGKEKHIKDILSDIIRNQNNEMVDVIILHFTDPDVLKIRKMTEVRKVTFLILNELIEQDKTELFIKTLNSGQFIDINKKNYEQSLIKTAVKKGNVDIVKLLVEKGVTLPKEPVEGSFLISLAVTESNESSKQNRLDIVKILINKGIQADYAAVSSAASKGDVEIVKFLVDRFGFDVNSYSYSIYNKDIFSEALNYSNHLPERNRLEIVKFCLEKGYRITSKSFDFINQNFDMKFKMELIHTLSQNHLDIRIFNLIIGQGNLEIIQELLKHHQLDLNGQDQEGCSPLEAFVKHISDQRTANLDLLDFLLQKGARVGQEFIAKAIESKCVALLKYLIDKKIIEPKELLTDKSALVEYLIFGLRFGDDLDLVFPKEYQIDESKDQGSNILDLMNIENYLPDSSNGQQKNLFKVAKFLIKKGARVTKEFVQKVIKSENVPLLKYMFEKNVIDQATSFSVREYISTGAFKEIWRSGEKYSFTNKFHLFILEKSKSLEWLDFSANSELLERAAKTAESIFTFRQSIPELTGKSGVYFKSIMDKFIPFIQGRLKYFLSDKSEHELSNFQKDVVNIYDHHQLPKHLYTMIIDTINQKLLQAQENSLLDVILPPLIAEIHDISYAPINLLLSYPEMFGNAAEKAIFGANSDIGVKSIEFYKELDPRLKLLIENYSQAPNSIFEIMTAARKALINYLSVVMPELDAASLSVQYAFEQIRTIHHMPKKLAVALNEFVWKTREISDHDPFYDGYVVSAGNVNEDGESS